MTHDSLTEPSLTLHDRKGREGKGREQGSERRSIQDQVDLLTVGAAPLALAESDHCPACRVARELREHRDATYPDWGDRRGMLNFAAIIAERCCPDWKPTIAAEATA